MALIAKSAGWQENEDTGDMEFVVVLAANKKEDVPEITFDDVWNETPLELKRA